MKQTSTIGEQSSMQTSFVSSVLPEPGCKALLLNSAFISRIAFGLLTLFCLFTPASACDNSYFQLDSVVFDGTHYTAHTTLCIGQGLTGTQIGAGGNTTVFAIAAFGVGTQIIGFSPSSVTNTTTNCTVQGNLELDSLHLDTIVGDGYSPNSMVKFVPTNGCNFTCFYSTANCGLAGTLCIEIDIVMNGLPDSLVAIGVEGTGLLFNGCHRFSHGGFATNDMTIPWWVFPVEWGAFDANRSQEGVRLTWETLQEDGNDHFRILHSTDAVNWRKIDVLDAVGDSEHSTNYTYLDRNPALGTNHYRIVQVDREGSQTATEVRTVTVPLPSGLALRKVGPVPAREELRLNLESDRTQDLLIQVMDLKGQMHLAKAFAVRVGSNEVNLDLAKLPTGCYLLVVQGETQTFHQKILLN